MTVHRDVVARHDLTELTIVTREQGTTMTIELAGQWDLAGVPAARRAVAQVLSGCPECVVLDLSRLVFIDSSGLQATIELAHRATATSIRLVIIPGPPSVQRVFEITGLTERLPFIDPQPTAVKLAHHPERGGRAAQVAPDHPRSRSSQAASSASWISASTR